jgi:tripeptide aminopeptidase
LINQSRLVQTFLELVAIDSPSGQEEAIGANLMQRFAALGGEAARDKHGNVIARWPGNGDDWLMLSAHMDTVGKDTGIRPAIRDGIIYSDGTTILGGDDKSGIAAILEVLVSLAEDKLNHPPLEVVISVGEEVGLQGAKWLDKSQLRARRGYVLDSGGAIGSIVVSAPSQDSLRVVVHGKKAHAGSEPENGINAIRVASEAIAAMPLGRIDFETTANIGVIEGGTATNIVPDEVKVRGEARSRDGAKLAAQTAVMVRAFEEAAARHGTSRRTARHTGRHHRHSPVQRLSFRPRNASGDAGSPGSAAAWFRARVPGQRRRGRRQHLRRSRYPVRSAQHRDGRCAYPTGAHRDR